MPGDNNGSGAVTNRQLYELMTEIHNEISGIKVQLAGLPCEARKVRIETLQQEQGRLRDDVEGLQKESRFIGGLAGLLAAVAAAWAAIKP